MIFESIELENIDEEIYDRIIKSINNLEKTEEINKNNVLNYFVKDLVDLDKNRFGIEKFYPCNDGRIEELSIEINKKIKEIELLIKILKKELEYNIREAEHILHCFNEKIIFY
jgi:hypothetical protein